MVQVAQKGATAARRATNLNFVRSLERVASASRRLGYTETVSRDLARTGHVSFAEAAASLKKRPAPSELKKQTPNPKVAKNNANTSPNPQGETSITPSLTRPDMGEYRKTKGHHVHSKKAFEGHVNYDPKKGFSMSDEYMKSLGVEHKKVTALQQKKFTELAKSGRPNTMQEHSRIAVESLVEGSNGTLSTEQARSIVAKSLNDLRNKGVRVPTTMPWKKK